MLSRHALRSPSAHCYPALTLSSVDCSMNARQRAAGEIAEGQKKSITHMVVGHLNFSLAKYDFVRPLHLSSGYRTLFFAIALLFTSVTRQFGFSRDLMDDVTPDGQSLRG